MLWQVSVYLWHSLLTSLHPIPGAEGSISNTYSWIPGNLAFSKDEPGYIPIFIILVIPASIRQGLL